MEFYCNAKELWSCENCWGHATINHSTNRKKIPSAWRTFIFQSPLNNISIDAWSKNHGILLQCQGVMEVRNFWVKKSRHATINHSIKRKIPPSARWPFIFWSSPDNKPIDAWSKNHGTILQSRRVMELQIFWCKIRSCNKQTFQSPHNNLQQYKITFQHDLFYRRLGWPWFFSSLWIFFIIVVTETWP